MRSLSRRGADILVVLDFSGIVMFGGCEVLLDVWWRDGPDLNGSRFHLPTFGCLRSITTTMTSRVILFDLPLDDGSNRRSLDFAVPGRYLHMFCGGGSCLCHCTVLEPFAYGGLKVDKQSTYRISQLGYRLHCA
jgi:hypothetical protein